MIKEGDKLVFKNSLKDIEEEEFNKWKEGDICECVRAYPKQTAQGSQHWSAKYLMNHRLFKIKNIKNDEEYLWNDDPRDDVYIHNWFYTISEWRDQQICILND